MNRNILSGIFLFALILSVYLAGCVGKEISIEAIRVTLNKSEMTLQVGANETLTVTIEPNLAVNKFVTWSSDNESVATVDNGKVTAVGVGTATITATTVDGSKTATCSVIVTAATVSVTEVTLNKTTLSLEVGVSETLLPSIAPDNATNKNVTWRSDKTTVATVNGNGRVSAVGVGTANITVTTVDGSRTATCAVMVTQPVNGQYTEHFNNSASNYFEFYQRATGGVASQSEQGTTILSLKIDPNVPVGPGSREGAEIKSKDYTHFGTYSARIKIPYATIQPKVGAVVGYFTYNQEDPSRLSEIDFEWLIADPRIIYIGTWTGPVSNPHRIGRVINLATGQIYETIYYRGGENGRALTGTQSLPASITPINNYNAASQFYVYGFDWRSDRLAWWVMHPDTNEKIVLWDYSGTTPGGFTGIPPNRSNYLFNFWHTSNWSVWGIPGSTERPRYTFETEVDWMSYTPF